MLNSQTPKTNTSEFSRCGERKQITDYRKHLSPTQTSDAYIKEKISDALWQDEVIRAVEYSEIDVYVLNGVVHLSGHILGTNSQSRVENAIQGISSVLKINNNLVLDDKLTYEVATSLSSIEHTFDCKFFTGASHGVITLNGEVNTLNVKFLAEKCAAKNSNVRGVINSIQVMGGQSGLVPVPFLQPTIGETIYFLDWAFGVVKQVIINPNNRLVVAMVIVGKFNEYQNRALTANQLSEQSITVPMTAVRYMNRVSGFLNIHSTEKNLYSEFKRTHFVAPHKDWLPPYPYCLEDVIMPTEIKHFQFESVSEDTALREEYISNDSLGG